MLGENYQIAKDIFENWMTYHHNDIKCRTKFAMGNMWYVLTVGEYCFHFTDGRFKFKRFQLVEAWTSSSGKLLDDEEAMKALIDTARDYEIELLLTREKV